MGEDSAKLVGTANSVPGRFKGGAVRPSVHLWPNGEYTLGYAPGAGFEEEMTWAKWTQGVLGTIDLAIPTNSHKDLEEVRPRRGQKGLTARGARMVRNACDALERFYGRDNLSFCTLTLPRLSYEEFWVASSSWAEIVRRFYQKLGRRLRKLGSSSSYVGVTELQPSRSSRDGVPALHVHFVFVGRRRGGSQWLVHWSELRSWWQDSLEWALSRAVDCTHAENVQRVRATASGYMSKYMSKGGDLTDPILSNEMGWSLPTSWYNVSLNLKRWVTDNTFVSPEMSELMECAWRSGSLREASEYFYEGIIEEMSGPGPHYCIGRLTREDYEDMCELYRAQQYEVVYSSA